MVTAEPHPLAASASEHPSRHKFDMAIFHPADRAHWRAWLSAHAGTTKGVWLCSWDSADLGTSCAYIDAVEEAICFGWIDSTITRLDEHRRLQMFTPRKTKSSWTRLNRRRAAAAEAAGQMTDAGRAAIAVAQANGYWTILDSVEDLIEGDELAAALDAVPAARAHWDAFSASRKKFALWQVVSAARPETRAARIARIVALAEHGESL